MTNTNNAYRKLPSPTNRRKLADYLNRHPMATAMATVEELEFLRINHFI